MGVVRAITVSITGIVTVFLVLSLLMGFVYLLAAVLKREEKAEIPQNAEISVDNETAAMIMAITAHELGTDPRELRFIFIREAEHEVQSNS